MFTSQPYIVGQTPFPAAVRCNLFQALLIGFPMAVYGHGALYQYFA